jgi:hypothetical protein
MKTGIQKKKSWIGLKELRGFSLLAPTPTFTLEPTQNQLSESFLEEE